MRVVIILVLVLTLAAAAQVRSFGLGLIIGEPTGISAKWNFSPPHALDFHLAWSFNGGIAIGADWMVHMGWLAFPWRPYLGAGGRMAVHEGKKDDEGEPGEGEVHVSGRGLIGIEYLFLEGHLGVAAEVGLGLDFVPAVGFDLSGGIAFRYYF